MSVYIDDNKLVIMTEPKTIHFNMTKNVDNNLKHGTDDIRKCNEILPEHVIKN